MNKDSVKFGNITLSQLTRFLVDSCEKDALISRGYITDSELNDAYKEKGSFSKFKYTDSHSIFSKIRLFFSDLEKEFDFDLLEVTQKQSIDGQYSEIVKISPINLFIFSFIWNYFIQIPGTRPFENTQNNLAKKIIYDFFLKQKDTLFIDFINFYGNYSIDSILSEILVQTKLSLEDLYNRVASEMPDSESDPYQHVKRSINKCRKDDNNLNWKVCYPLLKAVNKINKQYAQTIFTVYIYKNIKEALHHLSIKKQDWLYLEEFCKYSGPKSPVDFVEKHVNMENLKQINHYVSILENLSQCNTRQSISKFQKQLNELHYELPHSFSFWENWFCAKDYIIKFLETGDISNLESATTWYIKALDMGKYFAGKSLELFIHEAICVSSYFDFKTNHENARARLSKTDNYSSDTTTPLDKNTKKFYDFGQTFDLLLNNIQDSYNIYYKCTENFWDRFSPVSEKSVKIRKADYVSAIGIVTNSTPEENKVFKSKEFLLNISDKKINNILPTTHDVAYTPISTAIIQGFYDVLDVYLDKKKYPSLNVNIPNTNNCYPFHEMLTQFIRHPEKKTDSREYVFKILERTSPSVLKTKTNRQRLSPLQTAIESLDIEIISSMLNKMFGENKMPDDFLISADEVSPLYYAIQIKSFYLNPKTIFERFNIGNINFKNLYLSGFSKTEKEEKYSQSMLNSLEMFTDLEKSIIEEKSHINKEEINEKANQIIKLLISKTNDVDKFINYSMRDSIRNNQGCNALLYACELNDINSCRLLLDAGANLDQAIGTVSMISTPSDAKLPMPNNFILRAINFKSWDCLEFFLREQIDIARKYMHRKEINMTYLVVFLISLLDEIRFSPQKAHQNSQIIEKFLPLFISAGADLNEETCWGSAGELLGL